MRPVRVLPLPAHVVLRTDGHVTLGDAGVLLLCSYEYRMHHSIGPEPAAHMNSACSALNRLVKAMNFYEGDQVHQDTTYQHSGQDSERALA